MSHADPARFREVVLWVVVHVCVAVSFVLMAFISERRFAKRVSWPTATVGAIGLFMVLALEAVRHCTSGEGGLRAMSWLFGMVLALPLAVLAGFLSTWWMVKQAGLSSTTWCTVTASVYALLITNYGLSHW